MSGARLFSGVVVAGLLMAAALQLIVRIVPTPPGDIQPDLVKAAAVVGLGSACVGAGWNAILLSLRSHPDWARLTLQAGLVGLTVALAEWLLAVGLFGGFIYQRNEAVASVAFFAILLLVPSWLLLAPIVALLVRVPARPQRRHTAWHLCAALVLPVLVVAGFALSGFVTSRLGLA